MEAHNPTIQVTGAGDDGPEVPSKTVRFQCGLLRETETFSEEDLEDVSLEALLEFVVDMLNAKVRRSAERARYTASGVRHGYYP